MGEIHDAYDTILILDFGSQVGFPPPSRSNLIVLQYSHLITRRCRELNVYAELMPCTQKIKDLSWKPKGNLSLPLKRFARTHLLRITYRDYSFRVSLLGIRRRCTSCRPGCLRSRRSRPGHLLRPAGAVPIPTDIRTCSNLVRRERNWRPCLGGRL